MDDRTIRSLFERQPEKSVPDTEELAEGALTTEDQEKVRLAREVFAILVKTFKSFRIYQANNELLVRFQKDLEVKMQEFFQRFEDLELRVRTDTISLLGQPIYRPQDLNDNLAHDLFRDGLRRITFHTGLPPEELLGFLDVLKRTSDRTLEQDYDLITLFWEKDFKYITYHAVEELLPEGIDPKEVEQHAEEQIDRITTMNFYSEEDDSVYVEPEFGASVDEKRQDIFDNAAPSEETILKSQLVSTFHALETEEIRHIRREIESEKTEDLLLDVADTILEIIYTEHSFEDFEMLMGSLEQILAMYIALPDLDRAAETLKRLHFLAEGFRQTSAKATAVVEAIIDRSGTEERIAPLFSGLGSGSRISPTSLGNFLVHLGPSSIPLIGRTLSETTDNDMRKNLCDVLVLMGRRYFDKVMEALGEKNERDIRNKIYILTRIGDEKSVGFFRKLLQHQNAAIRQVVVSSLVHFYNPVTRDFLIQTLNDNDPAVRISVLKSLGQTKDLKVLEAILPLVREARFHERPLQEKRVFFSTLASLGGNPLCPSLGAILSRQSLKDKDKDDEVRICAAEALGQIGSPDAVKFLKEGLAIKRKAIAKTCEEQLHLIAERLKDVQ